MDRFYSFFLLCVLLLSTLAINPAMGASDEAADGAVRITFKRAAVPSFLVGKREPQMDEAMDQTLSCPIGKICIDDPTILPNAGATLTRLVDQRLRDRFGRQVVPRSEVQNAEDEIKLNSDKDTPRTMAGKLGRLLNVDVVVIGTVWRYRDRGTVAGMPDSPSSVAFAIYFVEAASGRTLWRGFFDGTQQTLLEDIFQAKKQLKMGLKWLTANELAEYGVRDVFRKFPSTILPGDFWGGEK